MDTFELLLYIYVITVIISLFFNIENRRLYTVENI